jgi:ribonucleoside-diphosphate reductase alpha chain
MVEWFEDPVGAEIVRRKYLHEGEKDFVDAAERISACFDGGLRERIRLALLNAEFFPGGRSLFALGCKGKFKATTSNCYVLPSPADSLDSIFEVGKQMAVIFSHGGGCGVNVSRLRPRGARVRNASRTSTGAASFVSFYDKIASLINQNGRRGALLVGLACDHPDLEEFLKVKQNDDRIQSANISILFDDAFMKAAAVGDNYRLHFIVDSTGEQFSRDIDAADFFRRFGESNRDYAEPGAIFIDRVRGWNLLTADPEYQIEVANPCGEFFGNAFSACKLGRLNIYSLIDRPFTEQAELDADLLRERVDLAVEALDVIIDYGCELQPLAENRRKVQDYRQIGLGVFGLADALIALGIRYGSPTAISFCERLFREIFLQALRTSNRLAREKGAFPSCRPDLLVRAPILQFLQSAEPNLLADISRFGLRNASLLSVAPTGSISTMCGFSAAPNLCTGSSINERLIPWRGKENCSRFSPGPSATCWAGTAWKKPQWSHCGRSTLILRQPTILPRVIGCGCRRPFRPMWTMESARRLICLPAPQPRRS